MADKKAAGRKDMKRIVISGYYGFGNIGDEAVLDGICAGLRGVGIDADITAISVDPARTVREHPGLKAVGRMSLCGISQAIMKSDLFISGGGSLFQDVTSARSPYYYLSLIRLAQMLRRKTMIYAQGVGPLQRPAICAAVAKAFNGANAITVRDLDSKALCEHIGVTREVQVCTDPSFLVEPNFDAADRIIEQANLSGRELVGVALRPWPGYENWLADAARTIVNACSKIGAQAVFIPMMEPEDAIFGEQSITLAHGGDPRTAKGLIARCKMVVGMRLHSLIFAASEAVPFVPIAYDPKVTSFAVETGGIAGIEIGEQNMGALTEAILAAWTNRGGSLPNIAQLRESAAIPARIAADMLT